MCMQQMRLPGLLARLPLRHLHHVAPLPGPAHAAGCRHMRLATLAGPRPCAAARPGKPHLHSLQPCSVLVLFSHHTWRTCLGICARALPLSFCRS